MGKQYSDYNIVLQDLVDRFGYIKASLETLAEFALDLLQTRNKDDLEFKYDGRTGNLVSVELAKNGGVAPEDDHVCIEETGQTLSSVVHENRENSRQICEQYIELLPESLAGLHEEWQALNVALGEVPPEVLKLLDGVRGRKWRPFVRRKVVIPLLYWPRLPSRENWHSAINRRRRAVFLHAQGPCRVDHLLEYAAETDPTENWQKVCRRMDSFIMDLQAIAPELNATINVDPFVPNTFQRAILEALDGRALKKQPLADETCGGEGTRLYRPGGLKELRKAGMVDHKHGLGYYRPDALPPSP